MAFRKARKAYNFRLDDLTAERLKYMAGDLRISQANLIEELVSACFDSACVSYDVSGFQRFIDSYKERFEYLRTIEGDE